MESSYNNLQIVLDSPVIRGKTVTALNEDGLLEVMQSIIYKRQYMDEPFYVLDLGIVISLYEKWTGSLPMIHPYYAFKCNSDTALLGELAALGSNFDCSSLAEIEAVLALGVSPDRIIYANPCKPESHIRYAVSVGVNLTTFDSVDELDKIRKWHPKCDLLIRIKAPDDSKATYPQDSKYGAHPDEIVPLLEAAQSSRLNVTGVSFHIGSAATDFRAFHGAIAAAKMVFDTATRLGMTKMRVLDIGGGFSPNQQFYEAASILQDALQSCFPNDSGLTVISEPGRFFAESAFKLAAKIIGKRVRGELREYWISDGKFGSLTYVPCHQALAKCTPFACTSNPENPTCIGLRTYDSTVFGPTCDADDKVFTDHQLPELQTSDWLLFSDIGAYTSVCGSKYNGFNTGDIPTYLVYSNTN